MNIEVISNNGSIVIRIHEKSGKFLDLIMSTDETQELVSRMMDAVSHTLNNGVVNG